MKRAFLLENGKAGLELIEEAFVLLRSCPSSILATYYLGSAPFAAGFMVFCADLGRSAGAEERLGLATLAMTALFVWMKYFHARFANKLLAHLRGDAATGPTGSPPIRIAAAQAIIHSTGLIVLPIAFLILLPFGWVYAFYQNASALDDGKSGLRDLMRDSFRQSKLWPAQNHLILLVLSMFGFYVLLNWIMLGAVIPQLLKMFFGLESVFTQSPLSIFNTTFIAATFILTYLSVDPLVKTCYVLRCFYGKSLQSGEDLKTEIRRLAGRAAAVTAGVLLVLSPPSVSAEAPPDSPAPAATSNELEQSISTVIQQNKYTWRDPKPKAKAEKDGLLTGFFKSISKLARKLFQTIGDWIQKILEWLFKRDRQVSPAGNSAGWQKPPLWLLISLLVAAAAGIVFAVYRFKKGRIKTAAAESTALAPLPDLEDENTIANDLPEDDWTKMGKRFLESGEYRLALRAFYLASLAHLASRGFITITRSKSNRDYEKEVKRRGHALPELPVLFGENVGIFDRIWYGFHEVNAELVTEFVANLEKIKAAA